ncbi:MAG TPA: hypothetical protein VLS87_04515 [Woeseiaceae bacterium]|nr:hypothetical protein [Woeseiaceae bacterium]
MIARYLFFWLILAVVAIMNGTLRQFVYGPHMPELAAHQLSTVTGILLAGITVWILNRFWPIGSAKEAWIIGACWFLMTVAFEFGFGHYVAGHSWSRLLADYNVLDGRVWSLFLVWIAVLPYVTWRLGKP